jgi:hypothetical protein
MKSLTGKWPTLLIAYALGITFPGFSCGQVNTEKAGGPGFVRYTPSRIEWLALELQAYYGDTSFGNERHKVNFLVDGDDTIIIVVHYLSGVDREQMNKRVESARRIIGLSARNRGWNWVKIKEVFEKIE